MDVPRNYSRYGIRPDWFRENLQALSRPDLICVTSQMTYWYPGVAETIAVIREVFPDTFIVLGGIYASLCKAHAEKYAGADQIVTGSGEPRILRLLSDLTGFATQPVFKADDLDTYPYPAFDLQHKINYLPLLTSKGCPFACAYCASPVLQPKWIRRDPFSVVEEIQYWARYHSVKDFVFYDDALLLNGEEHAVPMLEKIVAAGLNVRFHTPNAVHIRGLTQSAARLMYEAGFKTLRLGLETTTTDESGKLDNKVTIEEFMAAVAFLKAAGFGKDQIGAYLLVGLPEQSRGSITASIQAVKKSGITPVPAYYSPIPHTPLWKKAVASSRYDLNADPIFTNNAILPCQQEVFSWDILSSLKKQTAA
jgi:radical SAM superfamily enzyme YgiQ (UPF0313 family)